MTQTSPHDSLTVVAEDGGDEPDKFLKVLQSLSGHQISTPCRLELVNKVSERFSQRGFFDCLLSVIANAKCLKTLLVKFPNCDWPSNNGSCHVGALFVKLLNAFAVRGVIEELLFFCHECPFVGAISETQKHAIESAFKELKRLRHFGWMMRDPRGTTVDAICVGLQHCKSLETVSFYESWCNDPASGFIDFLSWAPTSSNMKQLWIMSANYLSPAVVTRFSQVLMPKRTTKSFHIELLHLNLQVNSEAIDVLIQALEHTTIDVSFNGVDVDCVELLPGNARGATKEDVQRRLENAHKSHVANRTESALQMIKYSRWLLHPSCYILPIEIRIRVLEFMTPHLSKHEFSVISQILAFRYNGRNFWNLLDSSVRTIDGDDFSARNLYSVCARWQKLVHKI
ncbi:hypothetical protein HK102_006012 [Quaeritorhiza haematococci]|nr:hypothetical protein HK102_006012 [Quaeritorhiza haematococci]